MQGYASGCFDAHSLGCGTGAQAHLASFREALSSQTAGMPTSWHQLRGDHNDSSSRTSAMEGESKGMRPPRPSW